MTREDYFKLILDAVINKKNFPEGLVLWRKLECSRRNIGYSAQLAEFEFMVALNAKEEFIKLVEAGGHDSEDGYWTSTKK